MDKSTRLAHPPTPQDALPPAPPNGLAPRPSPRHSRSRGNAVSYSPTAAPAAASHSGDSHPDEASHGTGPAHRVSIANHAQTTSSAGGAPPSRLSTSTSERQYQEQSPPAYVIPLSKMPKQIQNGKNVVHAPIFTTPSSVRVWTTSLNAGAKDLDGNSGAKYKQELLLSLPRLFPPGFDVYALSIQEGKGDAVNQLVAEHLKQSKIVRLPTTTKIEGRGDGSFLTTKHTGIALYVHEALLPFVTVLGSVPYSLGLTEGSKGGACLLIMIAGMTFLFISVHLPAHSLPGRYDSIQLVLSNCLSAMWPELAGFEVSGLIHNVIFVGDTNFKLNVNDDEAIAAIVDQGLVNQEMNWHAPLGDHLLTASLQSITPSHTHPLTKKNQPQQTTGTTAASPASAATNRPTMITVTQTIPSMNTTTTSKLDFTVDEDFSMPTRAPIHRPSTITYCQNPLSPSSSTSPQQDRTHLPKHRTPMSSVYDITETDDESYSPYYGVSAKTSPTAAQPTGGALEGSSDSGHPGNAHQLHPTHDPSVSIRFIGDLPHNEEGGFPLDLSPAHVTHATHLSSERGPHHALPPPPPNHVHRASSTETPVMFNYQQYRHYNYVQQLQHLLSLSYSHIQSGGTRDPPQQHPGRLSSSSASLTPNRMSVDQLVASSPMLVPTPSSLSQSKQAALPVVPAIPHLNSTFHFDQSFLSTLKALAYLYHKDELVMAHTTFGLLRYFTEPVPSPSLFPTYKRVEGTVLRKPDDETAVREVYRTRYKEPWYKKGNVVVRVPAYTDRILFSSLFEAITPLRLYHQSFQHNYQKYPLWAPPSSLYAPLQLALCDHPRLTSTISQFKSFWSSSRSSTPLNGIGPASPSSSFSTHTLSSSLLHQQQRRSQDVLSPLSTETVISANTLISYQPTKLISATQLEYDYPHLFLHHSHAPAPPAASSPSSPSMQENTHHLPSDALSHISPQGSARSRLSAPPSPRADGTTRQEVVELDLKIPFTSSSDLYSTIETLTFSDHRPVVAGFVMMLPHVNAPTTLVKVNDWMTSLHAAAQSSTHPHRDHTMGGIVHSPFPFFPSIPRAVFSCLTPPLQLLHSLAQQGCFCFQLEAVVLGLLVPEAIVPASGGDGEGRQAHTLHLTPGSQAKSLSSTSGAASNDPFSPTYRPPPPLLPLTTPAGPFKKTFAQDKKGGGAQSQHSTSSSSSSSSSRRASLPSITTIDEDVPMQYTLRPIPVARMCFPAPFEHMVVLPHVNNIMDSLNAISSSSHSGNSVKTSHHSTSQATPTPGTICTQTAPLALPNLKDQWTKPREGPIVHSIHREFEPSYTNLYGPIAALPIRVSDDHQHQQQQQQQQQQQPRSTRHPPRHSIAEGGMAVEKSTTTTTASHIQLKGSFATKNPYCVPCLHAGISIEMASPQFPRYMQANVKLSIFDFLYGEIFTQCLGQGESTQHDGMSPSTSTPTPGIDVDVDLLSGGTLVLVDGLPVRARIRLQPSYMTCKP